MEIDIFSLDKANICATVKVTFLQRGRGKMRNNLYHMGAAWFKKHGCFRVMITPRGGIELLHEDFRGMLGISRDRVKAEKNMNGNNVPGKYRAKFEDFLKTAYLKDDFADCTVFYLDDHGKVLGSADFSKWTHDGDHPRNVLAIAPDAYALDRSIRVCLPPVNGHTVPRGTCKVAFRFESEYQSMRLRKYSLECAVVKDLRETPNVGRSHGGANVHYKKVASM